MHNELPKSELVIYANITDAYQSNFLGDDDDLGEGYWY